MPEFDNLKRCYIAAVQCAMTMNIGYQQTKHGNEILHRFCEMLVDSSNYFDQDKQVMKQELQILKKAMETEIELFYGNGANYT